MTEPLVFWLLAALLTAVCGLLVAMPLRWQMRGRSRAESDLAVYRDQLAEVDRDVARGLMDESQAEATRTEISRRILAADTAQPDVTAGGRLGATRFAVLAVVVMPLLAIPLYMYTGAPGLPSQPFDERISKAPEEQSLDELVARVEQHLRGNPLDADGWRVIAPIYGRMGRFNDAADAYGRLIDLDGPTAQRLADLGEALVFADEGLVGERAANLFERALVMDPQNPQSQYFVGLAAAQEGDTDRARDIWKTLQDNADPDAPWARMVAQSLAALEAQASPQSPEVASPGAAIADLDPQARNQAIRGMVEGLDARLATDGGSEAEWRRLIRARLVLGDTQAATQALARGIENLAPDAEAAARLIAAAREMGLDVDPSDESIE